MSALAFTVLGFLLRPCQHSGSGCTSLTFITLYIAVQYAVRYTTAYINRTINYRYCIWAYGAVFKVYNTLYRIYIYIHTRETIRYDTNGTVIPDDRSSIQHRMLGHGIRSDPTILLVPCHLRSCVAVMVAARW